ncbi:unnamed protein product [Schistosoma margrebowiei]|uniref:Uncharacterized protein n=1 Tax=Schistosoma margrebowiei TaxID=48269 RepID=A0A183ME08_9TREM|nr:unnamed protein product [Schistosoma margrebowiei]
MEKFWNRYESITYLDSIIDEQGGSDADVNARIGNVMDVLVQLKNIWNSEQPSTNIKVTIFNVNVNTVLLYRDETWRTTTTIIKEAEVYIIKCLLKILDVRRPDTIINNLMCERTTYCGREQTRKRRWK